MAGVNKAIILGHLGQNPEISYTQAGLAVCKFSLATSRKQKNGQEVTQWHRCTAFDKAAELITKYVSKGSMLYIEGEISYSQYEKDGVTKYSTDIIVREFNFIGSGGGRQDGNQNSQQGGGHQGNQSGNYQGNQGGYQSNNAPSQGPNSNNFQGQTNPGMTGGQGSIPDDDIPF